VWLVKSRSSAVHLEEGKKECNKCDLTHALSVCCWPIIMIRPGGLLLVVPPHICCPSFSFMGGVAKQNK
jgi:hypothetical protein